MDTKTSLDLLFTLRDVHQDFMVSREAIGVSKRTYKTYDWSLEKFYTWLEGQGMLAHGRDLGCADFHAGQQEQVERLDLRCLDDQVDHVLHEGSVRRHEQDPGDSRVMQGP